MIKQRQESLERSAGAAPLWHPRIQVAPNDEVDELPAVLSSDFYVTVDEWIEDKVCIVIASWPRESADGLVFSGQIKSKCFRSHRLVATVDHFRESAGQIKRPLRIADTFWVRGDVTSLDGWTDVRDVTRAARQQARVAAATAAIGAVEPSELFATATNGSAGARRHHPPRVAACTALPVV